MDDSPLNAKSNPAVQWYVWAALGVVVARLWIQPMSSSFWLDETGTFLLVQGTFSQMLEKCARWVGQPTFFIAIVWPFAQLPGPREVILRLPSFIGLSIATAFVYRIGKRLLGDESAGAAALIFASVTAYYASDARPYALGLMAASGAGLFLIRWMDNGKLPDVIFYSILAALTVYFHFLFAALFLVHGLYVVLRLRQGAGPRLGSIVLAAVSIVVLLIPLTPLFVRVLSNRSSLSFLGTPRPAELFTASMPEFLYAFLVVGVLAAFILRSDFEYTPAPLGKAEFWLLVLWSVVPPALLFFVSYLTPMKVFVIRYFAVSVPGIALMIAWVIRGVRPLQARTVLVLALAAGAILDRGGRLWKLPHSNESWREGLAAVNQLTKSQPMPILMRSGFIESVDPATFSDPAKAELILAPLTAYPVGAPVIPLPYRATDQAFERLESIVVKTLLPSGKFVLVSSGGEEHYRMWLEGRLHADSFTFREIGNFGAITVSLFEKK